MMATETISSGNNQQPNPENITFAALTEDGEIIENDDKEALVAHLKKIGKNALILKSSPMPIVYF